MSESPLVGILMGSDSDWPKINKVADALQEFSIPYEVNVMSAHRTPQAVCEYATGAKERGLKVVICAAGGAAHLAGVVGCSYHVYLCWASPSKQTWRVDWTHCCPPSKCQVTFRWQLLPPIREVLATLVFLQRS